MSYRSGYNRKPVLTTFIAGASLAVMALAGCGNEDDNFKRCFSVPTTASADPNILKYLDRTDDTAAVGKAAFRAYIDDAAPNTPKNGGDIQNVTGWRQLRIDSAGLLADKAIDAGVIENDNMFVVNNQDRIGIEVTLFEAGSTKAGGTVTHYANGTEIHQNFSAKTNNTNVLEIECGLPANDPMNIIYDHTSGTSGKR